MPLALGPFCSYRLPDCQLSLLPVIRWLSLLLFLITISQIPPYLSSTLLRHCLLSSCHLGKSCLYEYRLTSDDTFVDLKKNTWPLWILCLMKTQPLLLICTNDQLVVPSLCSLKKIPE